MHYVSRGPKSTCVFHNVKKDPVTQFIVAGEASVTVHFMKSFFENYHRLVLY